MSAPSTPSNQRRIITSVVVMTWIGLVASTTASADPQRAPAPPASPTAALNPQRDPVPPSPVCNVRGDRQGCEDLCLGCEGNCTGPKSYKGHSSPRNPQACDELGRLYTSSQSFGEALKYFDASCNPGPVGVPGVAGTIPAVAVAPFWAGCYDLGKLSLNGQGTATNAPMARELINRACAMAGASVTYEACFALGQLLEAGTGGPTDVVGALGAYKKACDGSYPRACQAFLRLQPATRAPSHVAPGTSPSSIPIPPKSPGPRTPSPAPAPRVQ
jgi:hypothetical protein